METTASKIKGGSFLLTETDSSLIFIPEEFNEEQRMMRDMARDFLTQHVLNKLDAIDNQEEGLMEKLLDQAGELGLLATSIPEKYNGFGKDFNTSLLITEVVGAGHSFAVALAAHTGIGTLPILYFGTEEQKQKYLPKLATGELKASYCLTEPGSGSDALAAKTKAVLSADGKHYILNGQKMWITNAGFADIFIVFAQVDGDKFTGFIVEKGEGLTLGNEEHKMGIKGSSTRQVFLNECKVPVENVLGQIGKGHLIAFNILNIGRIKLAAAALGAAKRTVSLSVQYAKERHQFKQPIANFGAIQHKLAEQSILCYVCESALYRAGANIQEAEEHFKASGKSYEEALMMAASEFAIECAMLKVAGSEMLDYVVDEGVQIFGGYGFSADYPMDRAYRDSRINRIFEGTNEINRLLTMDMLLKRAMKGELDVMSAVMAVQKELTGIPEFGEENTALFSAEKKYIANMKKVLLLTAGAAAQKYMEKLAHEQEILMYLADICIWIYMAESALLRTEKLVSMKGEKEVSVYIDMARVYLNDAMEKVNIAAKNIVNAISEGDMQRMMLMGVKRFTKTSPFNTKDARRRIAAFVIDAGHYPF
ncbi:MAG: acyl-CoA dehydrogenase family protein [Cytophagaceae bacterium]|nr:acyl-CoA dehydrogenase family protein [Cytophagaceae bacterium]MDW8455800.1 acyl-CoA dehydrogenase family protein [Cytophagaceae bacterium]